MERESSRQYLGTTELTRIVEMSTKAKLVEAYGPLISGGDLGGRAGFKSTDALRVAEQRGRLGFRVFRIEGRRGRFARVEEVVDWLESQGQRDQGEADMK